MNAIITAATGYTNAELLIFLDSVERNCNNTKVFLIAFQQDRETINNLRVKYPFVEPIFVNERDRKEKKIYYWLARFLSVNCKDYSSVNSFLEFIGRLPLHIALERYFIALQLVRAFGNSFSNVLLTDSRDVFIQKDPFGLIHENLVSGLEPITIGDCPNYNSRWIRGIYGDDVLNNMSDQQIVCSGVTLGSVKEVEKYLMEMCSEIWKNLPRINTLHGFDQAIHNYLIHRKRIVPDLIDNQSGFIATLQYENPSNILTDSISGLVMVHGKCPAIIHQFDRHPHLIDFLGMTPKIA
ncbi:MAG: hypothetical protein ACRDEA_12090 [Microcystaceae cyanobacterium]